MKLREIKDNIEGHLQYIVLSEAMQARITDGGLDAEAIKRATAHWLLRFDRVHSHLKHEEWLQFAAEVRSYDIDLCARFDRVHSTSMAELALKRARHPDWLTPLFEQYPPLDWLMPQDGRTLWRLMRRPSAIAPLIGDARMDFLAPIGGHATLLQAMQHRLLEEWKDLQQMRNSTGHARTRARRRLVAADAAVDRIAESAQVAMALGVPLGEFDIPVMKRAAAPHLEVWRQVQDGEIAMADLDEAQIKQLAGLKGLAAVFNPPLWRGAEARALAMVETFNPSLRPLMARELSVLQSVPHRGGWSERVGSGHGWGRA